MSNTPLARVLVLSLALATAAARGQDAPTQSTLHPETHPQRYDRIVPPTTNDQFLSQARDLSRFFGKLPVHATLVRDVSEAVLATISARFGPALVAFWKALGIPDPLAAGEETLSRLLERLQFRSFDQQECRQLLQRWDGGMSPRDLDALKRLYLAQISTKIAYDCAANAAGDAIDTLYDAIDLVLGAARLVEKLGGPIAAALGATDLGRELKTMIIQRLLLALDSVVQSATASMAEPGRSKARAVVAALVGMYCQYTGVTPSTGFGGVPANVVTRIVFGVGCRAALITAPAIGFVHRTEKAHARAVTMARDGNLSGTYKQAFEKILNDRVDGSNAEFAERVSRRAISVSTRARASKFAALAAGALSQVAQLLSVVDPTLTSKVVACVSGALGVGLQGYAIFDSLKFYASLPREVDEAVTQAFHPGLERPPLARASALGPPGTGRAALSRAAARREFDTSVEALADAGRQGDGRSARVHLQRLQSADRALFGQLCASTELPVESVLDHHARMADVECATIALARGPMRPLLQALTRLDESVRQHCDAADAPAAPMSTTLQEAAPELDLACPAVVPAEPTVKLSVTLANSGTAAAEGITVRIAVPDGYRAGAATEATVQRLEPGGRVTLEWTVTGAPSAEQAGFVVTAQRGGELCAGRFVYVVR